MRKLIIIALAFLAACQGGRIYELNEAIPSAEWDAKNVLKFPVEISDTVSNCNVLINLRHHWNYPYSNLYLFVSIYSPGGTMVRDTVQVTMADASGKWFGSSSLGDVYQLRKLFRKNIKFGETGTYKFFIEQGMRTTKLQGIADVGLRIEKAN